MQVRPLIQKWHSTERYSSVYLIGDFLSAHTNVTSVKRGGSFVIATFCPQVKYAFFIAVGVDQHALLPFLNV